MRPLFVGGCPRSGTTMLGDMIGAHGACVCTPESQFKTDTLRDPRMRASINSGSLPLPKVLRAIRAQWRFKLWEIDPGTPEADDTPDYPALLLWLVRTYAMHAGRPEARFWVDHTPENIRYAGLLSDLFPEARFIHVVRDGRGIASSVMPLDWGPNTAFASAHWWMEQTSLGLAAEGALKDGSIMRIRYEDLVRSPEAVLKKICSFIDVDYEPAMAEGGGLRVPGYTRGQHSLVGERPSPSRLEAWKERLSQREIEIFESICGDLLRFLGYEEMFGIEARFMSASERVVYGTREFLGLILNEFRFRRRRGGI